jgi:hypothetical protein
MKRHLIVKSTNWMQIARKWFSSNGIYPDSDSDEYSTTEILNFFLAFEQNCNHEEWEDGKNRWRNARERKSKRSIIQQQGPFRALMSLIPFSVKRLEILFGVTNRPFTIEQFKSVLSPLRNIDWNLDTKDTQGLSVLKGRGNLNVPHLRDWMETAIEHGQIYSWQEVHNPELRSLPGRGLNARPSDEGLDIDADNFKTNSRNKRLVGGHSNNKWETRSYRRLKGMGIISI